MKKKLLTQLLPFIKRPTVLIVFLVLFLICFYPSKEQIAVLDLNVLKSEVKAYQDIYREQKKYEDVWQIKFMAEREVLQREEERLKLEKKPSETDVIRLQKKLLDLQQRYQTEASKIMFTTQLVSKDIEEKVLRTVEKIAKKGDYQIVLSKEKALYASHKIDITKAVIKALNKQSLSINYPDPSQTVLPQQESN